MNRIRSIREAGNVKRYHLVPLVGENLDATHQWNVAMLLLQLNPECSKELLCAALTHDIGERWAGDVPAPARWLLRKGAEEIERLETDVREELGVNFLPELNNEEISWLKGLDILECFMFAHDQVHLYGNANMAGTLNNARQYIIERQHQFPQAIIKALSEYQNDQQLRTKENFR